MRFHQVIFVAITLAGIATAVMAQRCGEGCFTDQNDGKYDIHNPRKFNVRMPEYANRISSGPRNILH